MKQSKLIIPPRPSILLELQALMQQEDIEISKITHLIKHDVSLYAILLSYVNSPWMGLAHEVKSVDTAISLMGLNKVINLLQAVLVKASFNDVPVLESFWDSARDVAGISRMLAEKYDTVHVEDAYTAGILHNVGIPVMLNNFAGYPEFLKNNAHRPSNEMCVYERNTFETDHFLQGAFLAKKWKISSSVALAIRYQPIAQSVLRGSKPLDADISSLIAVITLAKDISAEYRHFWRVEYTDFNTQCVDAALEYLNITTREYDGLKDDTIHELESAQVA